ncbi:hypothetical protein diail_7971 [Diaporthe ilicicola]|nr:hypothetical protein diail_7971 [Diaporthe ilicicola]
MASDDRPPRDSAVPKLNYQDWDDFHSFTNGAERFTIDVLLTTQQQLGVITEHGPKSSNEAAELPERIRINSQSIIQTLNKIRRSSRMQYGPIIMFRPYKTLVLFDQEIRHSAIELEKQAEETPARTLPNASASDSENHAQLAQLKSLIQFMDVHLSPRRKFLESPGCNRVFFSDLWLFYKPDFDGKWLGPVLKKVAIKSWGLSKNVESLELIPLMRATAQKEHLRQDLIRRGQTFVRVASVSPVHYNGSTLDKKIEVNTTIVIDFEEALSDKEDFKDWRTTIEHGLGEGRLFAAGFDGCGSKADATSSTAENTHDDSYVDVVRHQKFICGQLMILESGDEIPSIMISPRPLDQVGTLTEEELLIMSYRVFGYILDTSKWDVFDLSFASSMMERSGLEFDDLAIPSYIKEIVKNLTTHHLKQTKTIKNADDRSVNADNEACIARMAGVPLLQLQTEMDLPFVEDDWMEHIEKTFTWAKRWGCIVLLNQADAILQGQVDYGRGVSWDTAHQTVFRRIVLRMLDWFTGITFLVANQRPFLGPAGVEPPGKDMMSRINVSLLYPALDKDQTTKVFELNMRWINDLFAKQHQDDPRPACLVVDEDILEFSRAFYKQSHSVDRWNCRQIKKAFSTALALAHADAEISPEAQSESKTQDPWKVHLKATHFEVVARSMIRNGGERVTTRPPDYSQPVDARMRQPAPQQHPSPFAPRRQELTPRQRPQQQPPSGRPLPSSRQVPPAEYRAPMAPPPPPPPPLPQPSFVPLVDVEGAGRGSTIVRPKEFFLASPLSFEARPELLFLDWDAFKDARAQKGSTCSAIDVLQGDPVVSFDQEAQDNVWWSRWGDRNRGDATRAKTDPTAGPVSKVRISGGTQPSPLPERIRIHSKYITAILEEIKGSRISKSSFVMVRPFRALTYYEEKIRARYKELAAKLKGQPDHPDAEGKAKSTSEKQAGSSAAETQAKHPDVRSNDAFPSKYERKPPKDDSSSTTDSSKSDDGEAMNISSDTALQHLACLVEFIDMIQARRQYLLSGSCSKVTFADVWHLFKPGDEVLDQEQRQAYRILSINSSGHKTLPPWKELDSEESEGDEPTIKLHCVHIAFDGESLGSVRKTFDVVSFEAEEDITSLPVLPLRLVKDPDSEATGEGSGFRQDLIDRGRIFVRMVKPTPMHYNGPLLHPKEEVDSQVVIDFEQAFAQWARASSFRIPAVEKLIGKPIGQPLLDLPCLASCCAGEHIHQDAYAEQKWNEAYIGTLIPDPQDRARKPSLAIYPRAVSDKTFDESELSDEDLVIMSYKVCGFVLRTRKWAQMDLKHLSPLNSGGRTRQAGNNIPAIGSVAEGLDGTADTTLDQLVLPQGHKDIVKSLISQHFQDKVTKRYEAEEKDVVRGKGKGLIILLHGAPGVGKTSTAEGVAEAFNKPLFQITSGDLGTNARELEDALEWHFYLANKWNCVLLLDEADVFLSVRSPEDFQRNSLVAVFLRVLEYYAGVLFLTTNRIGDFDEAFSSRIHISLYYPPLKRSSTKKIFDLNLRNIQQRIEERGIEISIEHDQILSWASDYWRTHKKMRWNGRQIRNACQTALALAEYDAQNRPESTSFEADTQIQETTEKAVKIQLTIGHLETVAKAYLEFMRYLHEIYGKDADRRAKAMGIRAREFSMKNWDLPQEPPPQADDDDDESEEEAPGPKNAQQNKPVSQQTSGQASASITQPPAPGTSNPETSAHGLGPQTAPVAPFPYGSFPMPNMPNPFGMAAPFGQAQQPQATTYQQAADQQRQYLVNMAAWNTMMAGGQQVPYPGMAGMPGQPPGGSQPQGGSQPLGG